MTIQQFCNISQQREQAILNKYRKCKDCFPGVRYEKGSWTIPDGTRFPYDRRHLTKTSKDKRCHLLKAIDTYRYIDATMLHLPQKSFNLLISDLIAAELIQENGIDNPYGANKYDCTPKGSEAANLNWRDLAIFIKETTIAVATVTGAAFGAYTKAVST